jgi:hypothetical protein
MLHRDGCLDDAIQIACNRILEICDNYSNAFIRITAIATHGDRITDPGHGKLFKKYCFMAQTEARADIAASLKETMEK